MFKHGKATVQTACFWFPSWKSHCPNSLLLVSLMEKPLSKQPAFGFPHGKATVQTACFWFPHGKATVQPAFFGCPSSEGPFLAQFFFLQRNNKTPGVVLPILGLYAFGGLPCVLWGFFARAGGPGRLTEWAKGSGGSRRDGLGETEPGARNVWPLLTSFLLWRFGSPTKIDRTELVPLF